MDLQLRLYNGIGNILKLKGECHLNLLDDLDVAELSLKQIKYLKTLNNSCGMTTSQMAEILDLSKPSVTEMVKKFIKIGYVYKQNCPQDGRVYYLKLTDLGQQIVNLEAMTQKNLAERLLESLDEEDVIALINILEKLE